MTTYSNSKPGAPVKDAAHQLSSARKQDAALYVVATPIGNLADISERALTVLAGVDLIAAEDTRRTGRMLTHLGVRTELISCHEHNEMQRAEQIIQRIRAGEAVALVSDAGTPLMSDPGYRLVKAARDEGLYVIPVPGSCAAVAALSVAGLPSDRFRFEGFLPAASKARRARLSILCDASETLIFYVSVHKMRATLDDLSDIFGGDRAAMLAREITKLYETFYSGSLSDVRAKLAEDPGGSKGEFTLVVAGRVEEQLASAS
ncbi:MAG: 16S rRNA (cytidine(1402)-2'-O)-methyltransferase, partial [Gammaproteobacteria bacterium]|nr:16S rRNA (cytidine(1402)-2'-O)-methyltransferase [Gammaproteobacteria bacterium]